MLKWIGEVQEEPSEVRRGKNIEIIENLFTDSLFFIDFLWLHQFYFYRPPLVVEYFSYIPSITPIIFTDPLILTYIPSPTINEHSLMLHSLLVDQGTAMSQWCRHINIARGSSYKVNKHSVADPEVASGGVHTDFDRETWCTVAMGLGVWGGFGGPPPRKILKISFRRQYLRNHWADFDKLDLVWKLLKSSTILSRSRPGGRTCARCAPP